MADYTVLIVEDNEKNRKLLRDLLRVHGYRYLEAATVSAGWRWRGNALRI